MTGLGFFTVIGLLGGYALLDGPVERRAEFGVDVVTPLHANRQIRLVNAQAALRRKTWDAAGLTLDLGVTASQARGEIVQPDAQGRPQTLASPAWGIGPSVTARYTLAGSDALRVGLDLGAALMLYDRPFPAGGKRYDGMFQIGPHVVFAVPGGGRIALGTHWLHLSNGRGLTPQNPAYEGRALALRYTVPL
ncbi:MAG: hypothetical protein KF788_22495 [Piscinibacter sp.]|nr:hypothetical protein [Piscinibacter sp.]